MIRAHYNAIRHRSSGVTLIELAITIALVGIVAALIVNFAAPVRSYIDTSRRAGLADTADTALRRIGRDLRLALPNSVRVNGTGKFVEFLIVRTGGRYRADVGSVGTFCAGGAADDVLSFGAADDCFRALGAISNIAEVTTNDYLAVFNLQPGTPSADAYESGAATGGNKSKIRTAGSTTGPDRVEFTSHTFTQESPGNRFFIIEGAVSYGCDLTAKTLTRYWGYPIPVSQNAPPTGGGSSALLASGVTDCSFTYNSSVTAQGAGLVTMALQISAQVSGGDTETVSLYHSVHVNNVP